MSDTPPDRLSTDPDSPYYDADVLARNVGVRFKGEEKNNVDEYMVIFPPGVYPAPIYETAMALVLFGLLWAMRRHPFRHGWLFAVYLVLAGAERLLIEQIRINPVLDFMGLHATQAEMISGVFIALGIAGLALLTRRTPAAGKPQPA